MTTFPINHNSTTRSLKVTILLATLLASSPCTSHASEDSWPEWTVNLYGDGWVTEEVTDPEIIKIAQDAKRKVTIIFAGRLFDGTIEELYRTTQRNSASSESSYKLVTLAGTKSLTKEYVAIDGDKAFRIWEVNFIKDGKVMTLEGTYADKAGRDLLGKVFNSFRFTGRDVQ